MNLHIAIGLLLAVIGQTSGIQKMAEACDPSICRLPTCYCGGTAIPGGLTRRNTPQFVLLTFDDGVNGDNQEFYKNLFTKIRRNPNGCPIKATFYVSHEWTDYSDVQNLYAEGHEIASHTVTHQDGKDFSINEWTAEVLGQAEFLHKYGGVKVEDIKGMRAPHLAVGGDNMFDVLEKYGFYYDSSISTLTPSWPYTLDYKMEQSCPLPPCAEKSHPGLWEIPMTRLQPFDSKAREWCPMIDGCFDYGRENQDEKSIFRHFFKNFARINKQYKTPFPLMWHSSWFVRQNQIMFPYREKAFFKFVDTILKKKDVYFVTNQQLLKWMKNPQTLKQLEENPGFFGCEDVKADRPNKCNEFNTQTCVTEFKGADRYWKTCQVKNCPKQYPWMYDFGL